MTKRFIHLNKNDEENQMRKGDFESKSLANSINSNNNSQSPSPTGRAVGTWVGGQKGQKLQKKILRSGSFSSAIGTSKIVSFLSFNSFYFNN